MTKITFRKASMFFALLLFSFHIYAGDATITGFTLGNYLKVNVNTSISGKVINLSGSNITSYRTGWRLDNGTINNDATTNIGGSGIPTGGAYVPFTSLSFLRPTTQGLHVLKLWVKATGDTNATNDTITFNFTALSVNNYVTKVNLFEESTGTWCQYCPEGATVIASIKPLPNTAVAVFHHGDIYSTPEGETYFNAYFPVDIFTPGAMINMGEDGNYIINTQRSAWLGEMNARANRITPVQFAINPTYNATSRQLTVNLTANFKYVENGEYYTNAYIVEDNVVGTQVNATNPYTHNNIVRKMLGGSEGTSGVIPTVPVLNTDYTNTYNFTIPANWNVDNLSIIAMVYKNNGAMKNTVNAAKFPFSQLLSNNQFTQQAELSLTPNPAHDFITINDIAINNGDQVSVYNLNGQLLMTEELFPETTQINIATLPTGLYMVKVNSGNATFTKKIIKQ